MMARYTSFAFNYAWKETSVIYIAAGDRILIIKQDSNIKCYAKH